MWKEIQESIQLLWDKLGSWLNEFILLLPNLIVAIIVTLVSAFVVRYLQRYLKQIASKFIKTQSFVNLISNAGAILLWIITAFICLEILNLDTALKSLLAGAGVLGLAVGLALQEPIMNTFSGIMLSVKEYYNIGDLVETNGYMGHINQITLRNTVIRQITGEKVVIPNKDILHNPLVNYSIIGRRKVVLDCGVGYGDDLDEVENLTKKVLHQAFKEIPKEEDVEFFYTQFGDSSINFKVRFWLNIDGRLGHLQAKSKAIKVIKRAFDKAEFNIPFPIRTLDIDMKAFAPLAEKIIAKPNKSNGENKKNGVKNGIKSSSAN